MFIVFKKKFLGRYSISEDYTAFVGFELRKSQSRYQQYLFQMASESLHFGNLLIKYLKEKKLRFSQKIIGSYIYLNKSIKTVSEPRFFLRIIGIEKFMSGSI